MVKKLTAESFEKEAIRLGIAMDIFIDSANVAFVTDQVPGMTMLDLDGNVITRIRTPFNAHGIWVDMDGNMYSAGNEELVTKYIKL